MRLTNMFSRSYFPSAQRIGVATPTAALIATVFIVRARASGPQSFTFLQPGFTQQIWGVTDSFFLNDSPDVLLGGVAFAGNGNPMVAECLFAQTRIHQFLSQTGPAFDDAAQIVHLESVFSDPNQAVDLTGLGG